MINDAQFKQYLRQLSLKNVGEAGQADIANSHVLIIGCGGLGTAASIYLAGAGIGRIVLADDDVIETSNLPRQVTYGYADIGVSKVACLAKSLTNQNPNISIRAINKRLEASQLALEVSLADVVVDCSDNITTRQAVNQYCRQHNTDLVTAAAIGWNGQLSVFPFSSNLDVPCYRCLYPFDEIKGASKCSESAVMGPVVGMMGVYQALETLKLTLAVHRDSQDKQMPDLRLFDGLNGSWQSLRINKDTECSVCGNK